MKDSSHRQGEALPASLLFLTVAFLLVLPFLLCRGGLIRTPPTANRKF